jgi:hypothetical protein
MNLREMSDVARIGEINQYRKLVRKPLGMRPLRGMQRGQEDNMKMDLRETDCHSKETRIN